MSTLTSEPLKSLLASLYQQDAAGHDKLQQMREALSAEERAKLGHSADYLSFYSTVKDIPLAVSQETGRLLYMLARSIGARSIVEFGTSFGISTLQLAAALRDNGGGRLIGSEFEPSKIARARAHLRTARLDDLVELREGDALETLARELPTAIDLVLLDGAKPLYPKVLKLLEPSLRAGALLVADNADWSPEYLAIVREGGRYLSVPCGDDVELSMKLGI